MTLSFATLRSQPTASMPACGPAPAWGPAIGNQRDEGATPTEFTLVSDFADLQQLETEWTALFDRAGGPHQVFQTFGFVRTWIDTWHGSEQRADQQIAILVAHRDGRLVMIWPMVLERRTGLAVLGWLGAPMAQYGDVLVDDVTDRLELMRAGWHQLITQTAPDLVRLRKVRADAAVAPLLDEMKTLRCQQLEAPEVILRAGSAASFDALQTSKSRKNRRRLMRRLEECGEVSFEAHSSTPEASIVAVGGLSLKRRWLRERGHYSPTFAGNRLDRFVATAAQDRSTTTGCRVFSLRLDRAPIAVAIGFAVKRRLTLFMISHDLAFERAGVGILNIEAVLRHAEEEGFESVDLLAPKADYKMTWAHTSVSVVDHDIARTIRGWLCAHLFDAMLLPLGKSILERLPLPLKRILIGTSRWRVRRSDQG